MHIFDAIRGAWSWIQQSGNANIVLVGITAFYAYLTHRIMKATALQAKAALQPSLDICRLQKAADDNRYVYVKNRTSNPVIILDVRIKAHSTNRKPLVRQLSQYDDHLLSDNIDFSFGLPSQMGLNDDFFAFEILLTVCDMSRQMVLEYAFYPGTGSLHCRERYRISVRFHRLVQPVKWRWFRLKHWYERVGVPVQNSIGSQINGAVVLSGNFARACGDVLRRSKPTAVRGTKR